MNASLVFTPVRQLAELVRTKQVSPVELAKLSLDRLEKLGPKYNAVVTVTPERALDSARKAEKDISKGNYKGVLHGIPYGAKDIFATAGGIPTTWGVAPLQKQVFDYDAAVIERLDAAGAVLTAKLSMVELAGGAGYRHPNASFTGPGISPWNLNGWSGGSSSGSGSAVSAGLVPFAIGTETWGSILCPSSYCGVSGLRPTYGRVSRYGCMPAVWSLDKIGPFAGSADDCGLVLEAISGFDPRDEGTTKPAFKFDSGSKKRRFNLGLLKGSMDSADSGVKANLEKALGVLEGESIARIEEVAVPDLPYEAVIRTIMMSETASAYEDFAEAGLGTELTAESSRRGLYARYAVLAGDYIRALRIRRRICHDIDAQLAKYDAFVGPSYPTVAPPIDREFNTAFSGGKKRDIFGALGNVAGLPAIGVPTGLGDRGLPTGMQFMGRVNSENRILAIATAYQSVTGWHLKHPPGTLP
ncbi:MAG: amidase [SAR202 cluster bacterium]|nr:amidase [SAR202 cluster bacterium]